MSKFEKFDLWFKRINSAALAIASLLCLVSFLMTIMQVFTRYFLKFSFVWTEELSRYLMILVVMLCSGYLLRNNENPYVEVFYCRISGRKKYWLNFFLYSLITIVVAFILVIGIQLVFASMNKITPSLRIKWAIPYLAIPVGAFLMILQMPYLFTKNYREFLNSKNAINA